MDKDTEYRELGGEHTKVIDLGADKFALHFRADGMVLLYKLEVFKRVKGRCMYDYTFTGLMFEDTGLISQVFESMEAHQTNTKYHQDKNNDEGE